jgi:predicted ArsR family transcriptional regulator
MAEALLDDRDSQTLDAAFQKLGILRHLAGLLPYVKTVGTGDHFEHECIVSDVARHRPGVIDRHLHAHDAGVGDKSVGRLHSDDAAKRARHADRAALIAADCEIDLAGGDESCAAGR